MTASDKIAPKLVSSTPKANGNFVSLTKDFVFVFDEAIKKGNGKITINEGKNAYSIDVNDATQVQVSDKSLIINPRNDLLPNTHYTIKLPSTVIKDTANNKFAGKTISFDTVNSSSKLCVIDYDKLKFLESDANNGSITTTIALTLVGDTFKGGKGQVLTDVNVDHLPNGLTAIATKTSDTTAALKLTGNAIAHANANNVSNLKVSLGNDCFSNTKAVDVINAVKGDLSIDFSDPVKKKIIYSSTTFTESAKNDGSISNNLTLTVTDATFSGANGSPLKGATVKNVPAGLTPVITKTSDTTATVSLTGKAKLHGNTQDINNLTVTFSNASFGNNEKAINIENYKKSNLHIDFNDNVAKTITYDQTILTESPANNGAIANALTLTLSGDKFSGISGGALIGASVTNVPIGLNAIFTKINDTTASLTLTGKAITHGSAQDVTNLTVTLSDKSFVSGYAKNVTGATTTLNVDFADVGAIITGTKKADILLGTPANDIIYSNGGADTINGSGGNDTIDISHNVASSKIVLASLNDAVDTVIGFSGGALKSGGDVVDLKSIFNSKFSPSFASHLTLASDLKASNVFIFSAHPISIAEATKHIANDKDVVATDGYVVIADIENNNNTTIYYSNNLNNDGTETKLIVLSGTNIETLTPNNFLF